jgi:hypothetical protein
MKQATLKFTGATKNPIKAKPSAAQIAARKKFAEMARSGALNRKRQIARKANPAKKTVSQKISQLVHEGYPQKQSIAIALSEQRKGKVKSNPMQGALLRLHGNFYGLVKQDGNGLFTAYVLQKVKTGIGEEMDYYESKDFKTKQGAARYLANHGKTMTNPASGRKGSQTLLNPMAAPVKSSSYSNFKYCVEAKRSLGAAGSVFETVAMFATKAQAQDYAKAILKSHPSVTLRIKTYK